MSELASMGAMIVRPVFWFQPVFYALHGWLATEMALWMLFHPYKAYYLPGTSVQLPLTPGVFPRGRERLSAAIGRAVTEHLLTPQDIAVHISQWLSVTQVRQFLERIRPAVQNALAKPEQLKQFYRIADEVVPVFVENTVRHYLATLETDTGRRILTETLHDVYDRMLPKFRLDYTHAGFWVDVLFNTIITPDALRRILLESCDETQDARLEQAVRQQLSGWQGLILKFVDIKPMLARFREFLREQPETANTAILNWMDQLEIREKLAEQISRFAWDELNSESQEAVYQWLDRLVLERLRDDPDWVAAQVADMSQGTSRWLTRTLLRLNWDGVIAQLQQPATVAMVNRWIQGLLNQIQERQLIQRAMIAANIERLISDKLDQFSAQELETMIRNVCQHELRWLAFLGAFLGFWLGLISNLFMFTLHPFG